MEDEERSAASALEVLRQAPVRNLVLFNSITAAGLMLQTAVMSKQVFDITGREIDLALLGLAEFLPAVALVLVSGPLADRYDRRRVATFALAGEIVCAIALTLYARTNPTSVWPLFAIAVAYGACRSFMAPASRAMPAMVSRPGELPRTVAVTSATWTAAMIIGPATSGLLYAAAPWIAYAAAVGLLVVAMAALRRVRFVTAQALPDEVEPPTLHHAMEGLRFIRRTPILLAAISLDLFAVLFGGAVALIPVVAEERLGVGDVAYGFLRASPGIGAAVAALLIAIHPVRRHVGRTLLTVVAVFGVGTIVFGLTHSFVVAFVALAVLSAADMVSMFIRGSIGPLVTPDSKRGRVLAVENVFIGASNELGAFESGVAAQAFGPVVSIVGGGVATLAVVGTWLVAFPDLRDIDRFDDLETFSVEPAIPPMMPG